MFQWLNKEVNLALMNTVIDDEKEPTTVDEALAIPHREKAMENELSSIEGNDTC